jgi:hypothetical protein
MERGTERCAPCVLFDTLAHTRGTSRSSGATFITGSLSISISDRVRNIKRAWHTAVLKAHGYKPSSTKKRVDEETVVKTANLSAESHASLDAIDLHFHDLRREAGSRWLDGSVPCTRSGSNHGLFHLARPEWPSAQRRGWLNPLAVHAHDPGPGKSAEPLSFLAIDAKPDVIARNDRSVGIGLR